MSRLMLVMAVAMGAIALAQAAEPKPDGEAVVAFFIAENAAGPGLRGQRHTGRIEPARAPRSRRENAPDKLTAVVAG